MSKVLTGTEFNKLMKDNQLFKFTNRSGLHRDIQYKEGLILLKEPFDPSPSCGPGGLYFTWDTYFGRWSKQASETHEIVYDVLIPDNARVVLLGDKAKTDRMILSNKRMIDESELPEKANLKLITSYVNKKYPDHPEMLRKILDICRLCFRGLRIKVKDVESYVTFVNEKKGNFWVYKFLLAPDEGGFYFPSIDKLRNLPRDYFNVWAVDHYLDYMKTEHLYKLPDDVTEIIRHNQEFFRARKYRPQVQTVLNELL